LLDELGDITRTWDEVRLKRELRNVERWPMFELTRHLCYHLLYCKLGRWDKALEHASWIATSTPTTVTYNNLAVALIHLGRHEEGAEYLVQASEMPGGDTYVGLYANLAEAFAGMGAWTTAQSTFEHAVSLADRDKAEDMYRLSDSAACVGEYQRSVEYFARFVMLSTGAAWPEGAAPLEYVEANEALIPNVIVSGAMEEAALRVGARRDGSRATTVEPSSGSGEGNLATFEAFRSLRARANSAVLRDA
jgi:tetratricopeptide (TPR) repeat protein